MSKNIAGPPRKPTGPPHRDPYWSEDGHWHWDGTQWVSAEAQPLTPPVKPKKKWPVWKTVVLVPLVVIFVGAIASGVGTYVQMHKPVVTPDVACCGPGQTAEQICAALVDPVYGKFFYVNSNQANLQAFGPPALAQAGYGGYCYQTTAADLGGVGTALVGYTCTSPEGGTTPVMNLTEASHSCSGSAPGQKIWKATRLP